MLGWLDRLDQKILGPNGWLPRLGKQRPLTRRELVLFAVGGFVMMLGLGVAFRQVGPLSASQGNESVWESVLKAVPYSLLPAFIAAMHYVYHRRQIDTDPERRAGNSK